MYCTGNLTPPAPFQQAWTVYSGNEGPPRMLSADAMSALHAIIIFSSPVDEGQVAALCRLVQTIDGLGHDAPPILWVPHTAPPEAGLAHSEVDVADPVRGEVVNQLLELGLDGIVAGEPEGFNLALAVRAKIRKLASLSRTLNDIVNERRSRGQYTNYLKECIDCTLWEYLRVRFAPSIPPIDYSLPPGDLQRVDGFTLGPLLGRGTSGSVFQIMPQAPAQDGAAVPAQPQQVMKVVSKAGLTELADLKCIRRQMDVLNLLASPQCAHPNILQFFQAYHSPTHLFFRMEWGGPENLYRRLSHRQKPGDACRPLPFERVVSLITQAISVVAHLHLEPHVCHRDIKPENFIVQDVPGTPFVMKLTDFDLAFVQANGAVARSPCGTIPFTAPEVLLQREYDGMASDIWSLGVVLLEVLCGLRVVEQALALREPGGGPNGRLGQRPGDSLARKIRAGFEAPGSGSAVLAARCREELQVLSSPMAPLMDGMLTVDSTRRFKAPQMLAALRSIPVFAAEMGSTGELQAPVPAADADAVAAGTPPPEAGVPTALPLLGLP